jgi:N-acetyl-alpha-D-muramate 1-phosphate uridylyltransferase
MILAAGKGTRMRPLTLSTPKPLLTINDQPLLHHALTNLEAAGVTRVVINTHYLAQQIQGFVDTYKRTSHLDIILSHEPALLDSGGGILNALPHFNGQPFFLLNADAYWGHEGPAALTHLGQHWRDTMDGILMLVDTHKHSNSPGDYTLNTQTGHVHHRGDAPYAPYVYASLAILHPRMFDGKPQGVYHLVKTFFHASEDKQRLYGLLHTGPWWNVDTPDILLLLNQLAD